MKKLIRIATRPNLKYPLQYLISSVLRDIESTLLDKYLNFVDSLIYTTLMFIGEFFGGLIAFLFEKKFVKKTLFITSNQDKYMNIKLFKAKNGVRIIDKTPKMIFIIFCCALFDFVGKFFKSGLIWLFFYSCL